MDNLEIVVDGQGESENDVFFDAHSDESGTSRIPNHLLSDIEIVVDGQGESEIVVDGQGESENDVFLDAHSDESGTSRIPNHLLSDKPKAYEPQTVSLGPSHFGQPQLEKYEKIKERLLSHRFPYRNRRFKELVGSITHGQDQFFSTIRQSCFFTASDHPEYGSIMARDGLFLLQFLREMSSRWDFETSLSLAEIEPFEVPEDVLKVEKIVTSIFRPLLHELSVQEDIMKLQNQIPFFVLERIVQWEAKTYEEMKPMIRQQEKGTEKKRMLLDMILQHRNQDFNSIVRKAWHSLSPFPDMHVSEEDKLVLSWEGSHILEFVYENIIGPSQSKDHKSSEIRKNKRSALVRAVALDKKGVKFAAHKGLLNKICFDAKTYTFHLPIIEVNDRTDAVMRNLAAFELYVYTDKMKPIMCYMELMDQLIDTAEDVEVLKDGGIIRHRLGTDQDVANIWNGMRKGLDPNAEYGPIDTAINDAMTFYRSYRIWYAEFTKKYLSKPWLVVSLVVGCIITVLTIVQTVFSGEQLHHQ